ncbi:hypothetical protein J6590_073942 [Homalodisca vitripennis]|nr:hypothetical protein J6590_073942 [Homalodisca vitripennis]
MRSLNTGFEEMCSVVSDFEFDASGVSETWLHPSTSSDSYTIPGYVMLRSDRQENLENVGTQGGGVALYLKEGIAHEQRHLSRDVDRGIEKMDIRSRRTKQCYVRDCNNVDTKDPARMTNQCPV